MATASPKVNSRSTTITVAVVGLTTSSYMGEQGEGAGKSCLCNRFVWPHAGMYSLSLSLVLFINLSILVQIITILIIRTLSIIVNLVIVLLIILTFSTGERRLLV